MRDIFNHLESFGISIIGSKDALELLVNVSPDALHIHVSLLILFAVALLLRRRPDNWLPWLVLLLLDLVNEANDILHHSMRVPLDDRAAALHDLLNTMFWPTIILLFGRVLFPPARTPVLQPPSADQEATENQLSSRSRQ